MILALKMIFPSLPVLHTFLFSQMGLTPVTPDRPRNKKETAS